MISTSLRLYENMTPILKNVIASVNSVVSAAKNCENSTKNMFDVSTLSVAKSEIDKAQIAMNEYEKSMARVKGTSVSAASGIKDVSDEALKSSSAFSKAVVMAKKLAFSYGAFRTVKKFLEMSDDFLNIRTRLSNVASSFGVSSENMLNSIRSSASRSRAEFNLTADVIGKLGMQARSAFKSSDELVGFAEQLNKNFKIAGTDAEGIRSVMYNLTQALASGVLRGQDLNAVMSNAPVILEKVAKYLDSDMGSIRKLAEEGKLSAEVIKNAMLLSAEDTNKAFSNMPKTFGDIVTEIKNKMMNAFSGAMIKWSELLNSKDMQATINFIVSLLESLVGYVGFFVESVTSIIGFIAPIFSEVPGLINLIIDAFFAWKMATLGVAFAMNVLNLSMNANPIILVVSLILMAIMATVRWIRSVGGLSMAWLKFKLVVMKVFHGLALFINGYASMVASVVLSIVGVVLKAIQTMVNGAIKALNFVIGGLNKIPGVNIKTIGEAHFATDFKVKSNAFKDAMGDRLVTLGKKYGQREKDLESQIKQKQVEIDAKKKAELNAGVLPKFDVKPFNGGGGIGDKLGKIRDNTGAIKDKLDGDLSVSNEDLKEIRDVMFQRAIQNITWDKVEIKVDNSFGDVHESADTEGIIRSIEEGLEQAVDRMAVMS